MGLAALIVLSSVLLWEGRALAGLLRKSLDWVREVGRRGGGALVKLKREWVEELALELREGSGGGLIVVGSGRRCVRWFVKRLRRTEEVEVALGA